MSSLLAGKIAVVTGASSGIGRAIPAASPAKGECRHCGYHRAAVEAGLDARYHYPSGRRSFFQKTDVGRWDDVDALIGATVERHGRLDVMVNKRPTYSGTALLQTEPAQWEQVMRVNLTAYSTLQARVQQMITQEPRQEVRVV